MSFLTDDTFFFKNSGDTWSQTEPVSGTYRFEVHEDDFYSNPSIPTESSDEYQGKNRSELVTLQKLQEGREFVFDFDFMVEPGAANTADWLVLAQFHQTEDVAADGTLVDTAAASPPLAVQLYGERLYIVGRTDPNAATTVSPDNIQMYLATDPIVRGQFYNIRIEVTFDDAVNGQGRLKVYLDNVQIVDYTGPLGYNDIVGTYAQFGVYREQAAEAIAVQFRDLSLTSPDPTPPINGTAAADNLIADGVGFLESEVLNGYSGNDTLDGGYGADTMYGGAGDDIYVVNLAGDVAEERPGGVDQGGADLVQSDITYTIAAGIEDLTLRNSSNIDGTGNAGANILRGNTGHNVLRGLAGHDRLLGNEGNDALYGGDGNDTTLGGDGNDTLYGDANDDRLTGDLGNDALYGGDGNDTLDGGTGSDTLYGGLGDDEYYIADTATSAQETTGQGRDTVRTTISYDAGTGNSIEVLNISDQAGTSAIDLAGDNTANEIRGNAGINRLTGRDGNDLLWGFAGNDTLDGGNGDDTLYGGDGGDWVYGGAGNEVLYGGTGSDNLSGGIGQDTLYGESGNDTLDGGDGNDSLIGSADAETLRGGAGNDVLRGNGGNDSLDGGAGDDIYYVLNSATRITEAAGGGSDTVRTTVSLALDAGDEVEFLRVDDQTTTNALNLIGSSGVNELRGNNGANRLDGGGGDDSLRGFAGDDVYIVDSAGDRVFELDGEGRDTIQTAVNFTISSTQFIEVLQASGTGDLILTGNQIDNAITGSSGNNQLRGNDGNDTLTGLGGNDTMYGGNGTDRVVLNVASTVVNASAGATSMVLTSSEGVDFISNDVEYIVFSDRTLTYAEATALRYSGGPSPIRGTEASEVLNGTAGAELIEGLGGSDWIVPGTGSDTIDGGEGRDMVSFSNLPDTPGRTNVQYRLLADLTTGQITTSGADVYQISNVERLTGSIFADRVRGSAGADDLRTLGDYDWIIATTGADVYDGGAGADMVSYVDWNPGRVVAVAADPLLLNGRPTAPSVTTGVVVDLNNTANNTNLAAGHTYISIERITGTSWADVFWGDGNENDFRGLGGYDWFVGSTGGRERYFGGDGVDTVTYFQSTAGVTASLMNGARVNGQETGYGSAGDAARDLYFEIENLVGSDFGDRLTGNSDRNTLMGLAGDDFLFGGAGIDMLHGGAGNDTIDGGAGSDYALFTGNRADYTVTRTGSNTVTVTGTDGTDTLVDVEYFRFGDQDLNIWSL